VTSGTATLTGVGNTRTLTYANMSTDAVTVQASITDASGTYTDSITVVKVREGTDGANGAAGQAGVTAFLTNEAATISAAADGTVGSFSGINTDIKVYVGLSDDTSNWTVTRTNSTGVTSTLSGSNVAITAMTVDSGYVDITATKSGTTVTKRFTLAKSKTGASGAAGATGATGATGASGAPAITSYLTNESVTISCDSSGNTLSGALANAVTSMKVINGTTDDTANWSFSASPASSASTAQWTLSGSQLTINSFSNTIDTHGVTITATRSGYPSLSKVFTLSKSKQGAAGATGATGPTGSTGAAGARGTMQFYIPIAGATSWSDTQANSATTSYGGNKVNDTVTQY